MFNHTSSSHWHDEQSSVTNPYVYANTTRRDPSEDNPKTRTSQYNFQCTQCPMQFETFRSFKRHGKVHATEIFSCEVCNTQFWERHKYEIHCSSHKSHKKCEKYGCQFPSKRQENNNTKTLDRCIVCGIMTSKTLKCQLCGDQFPKERALKGHMKKHNEKNFFVCKVCGKEFLQRNSFDNHSKSHIGYKCKECNHHFPQKRDLIIHTGEHARDKQFDCPICGAKFYGYIFDSHYRMHTPTNTLSCVSCGKQFIDEEALSSHKKEHAGEEVLICEVCGKPFHLKDASQFEQHYMMHDDDNFKCYDCGRCFASSKFLTRHRKRNH